jgi:hypothetical protein
LKGIKACIIDTINLVRGLIMSTFGVGK